MDLLSNNKIKIGLIILMSLLLLIKIISYFFEEHHLQVKPWHLPVLDAIFFAVGVLFFAFTTAVLSKFIMKEEIKGYD
ncbi:MAG: hypothetical protein ACE5KT_01100 [Methanosarcinales archaeon]